MDVVYRTLGHAKFKGATEKTEWFVRLHDDVKLFGKISALGESVYCIDDGNGEKYFAGDKVLFMQIYNLDPDAE